MTAPAIAQHNRREALFAAHHQTIERLRLAYYVGRMSDGEVAEVLTARGIVRNDVIEILCCLDDQRPSSALSAYRPADTWEPDRLRRACFTCTHWRGGVSRTTCWKHRFAALSDHACDDWRRNTDRFPLPAGVAVSAAE